MWVCRAAMVLAPSTIWSAERRSVPLSTGGWTGAPGPMPITGTCFCPPISTEEK